MFSFMEAITRVLYCVIIDLDARHVVLIVVQRKVTWVGMLSRSTRWSISWSSNTTHLTWQLIIDTTSELKYTWNECWAASYERSAVLDMVGNPEGRDASAAA